MTRDLADIDASIAAGHAARRSTHRLRSLSTLSVSFGVLGVWLVYVTASGQWGRVGDHWASAVTMVFGSFVAGSTPQGGGAVAFPVFTKVLDIDASVARTFSLCIQCVGMTAASASIIINRRTVVWRAVAVGAPVAISGFVFGAIVIGDDTGAFWPSRLPGAYVKVTFTLIVAAMALVVWSGYKVQIIERFETLPARGSRVVAAIIAAAFIGGVASALTGSGADVVLYLVVVVIIGVSPRVGVPTTVLVMTSVSIAGMLLYGIIDGQLDVTVTDGAVTHVGGNEVGELDPARFDLFGLWLAAAPIVAFGAPLGAWVSSRVTDRQLVRFVIALAAVETLSTIVFLDGLIVDPDPALIVYAVLGAITIVIGLTMLRRHRRAILGIGDLDLASSFTRDRLDVGDDFRTQLDERERP